MNYEFPYITRISDVLPAIEGRDDFVVADKGDYTIIQYSVVMSDTFPDVNGEFKTIGSFEERNLPQYQAKIRRECRGIAFCNETGTIIRRPMNKFFNINEREETQLNNLDFRKEHWVDTKLDGSFIAPMLVKDKILWATKMASPDFHDLVSDFVDKSDVFYEDFVCDCIHVGQTPIFEFMHPQKRIVIDYGKQPSLVLLAVRNMITGQYIDLDKTRAKQYGIPIVDQHSKVTDPKAFTEYVHDLKNAEGFVIRWADGHRVKIKAHEYLQIHKAKEAILQDRNICELILDEKLDDIKAHLPAEDRDRLTQFEYSFNFRLADMLYDLSNELTWIRENGLDRKTFAIEHAPKFEPFTRAILFKHFDVIDDNKLWDDIRNTIRNNLGRTVKYEAIRDCWFKDVIYNV